MPRSLAPRLDIDGSSKLIELCQNELERHRKYVVEHPEDISEIANWKWTDVQVQKLVLETGKADKAGE
jgi:hypothetical protein